MSDMMRQIASTSNALDETLRKKNNPARFVLDRLKQLLARFQKKLSDDFEMGIVLTGSAPFRLRSMEVSNPDLFIFTGLDESGNTAQLIQHYSQVSIMLVAMPKLEEKPYRVGFTS